MKKIAHKIYDTTPQINQLFPKKQSKILAGVKHDEEVGEKRARKFLLNCELVDAARKKRTHGSIADRDLNVEVEAQDWEILYEHNYKVYSDAFKESKQLEETKEIK